MSSILQARTARFSGLSTNFGTGWLAPTYDTRDYTDDHKEVAPIVEKLEFPSESPPLPPNFDLSQYCTPVEDQQSLGSCTAHAAMGLVEYYQNRAFGKFVNGSRLFVYKNTRNLMGATGDSGAWLRTTMGALALCGVLDEKYWPYTDVAPDFDRDPPAFAYSVANNFEALRYFCHDPLGENVPYLDVVTSVKKYLVAGIPSMFGFWGYASSFPSDVVGAFSVPPPSEPREGWGHALVAVGYDDNLEITNIQYPQMVAQGAFLIRNSWGTSWGEAGYGWIPYAYVHRKIACDFWSLISMGWVDTGQFHFDPDGGDGTNTRGASAMGTMTGRGGGAGTVGSKPTAGGMTGRGGPAGTVGSKPTADGMTGRGGSSGTIGKKATAGGMTGRGGPAGTVGSKPTADGMTGRGGSSGTIGKKATAGGMTGRGGPAGTVGSKPTADGMTGGGGGSKTIGKTTRKRQKAAKK